MDNSKNLVTLLEGMANSMDDEKTVSVNICPKNLINDILGVRIGELDISYEDTPINRLIEAKKLKANSYIEISPSGEGYYYSDLLSAWNDAASGVFANTSSQENAVAYAFYENGVGIVRLLTDTTLTLTNGNAITNGIILDLNGYTLTTTDVQLNNVEDMLFYGMKEGSKINFNYTSTSTSDTIIALQADCMRFYGGEYNVASLCATFVFCNSKRVEIKHSSINYTDNFSNPEISTLSKIIFYSNQSEIIGSNIVGICSNENINSKIVGVCATLGTHRLADTNIDISTKSTKVNCGVNVSNSVSGLDVSNCNISAVNNNTNNGSSIGIYTRTPTFLIDTNVTGVGSGVQAHSFLYIKGGRYESIGHGGIYTGKGCIAYIDSITTVRTPEGEGNMQEFAIGGTYFGYGSRVFCNNVTFLNDAVGRPNKAAFAVKQGTYDEEVVTEVYVSNCTCSPARIRVDGDEWTDPAKTKQKHQLLYIGNNVKLIDGENEITVTNENLNTLKDEGKITGVGGLGDVHYLDVDKFSLFRKA